MSGEPLEEHWAPARVVLGGRTLELAGHLVVAWDEPPGPGEAPLTGELRLDRPAPQVAGVYVVAERGAVRYIGASGHLPRTFGPRGLGTDTDDDVVGDAHRLEEGRVHRMVVAATRAGHVLDVYVLPLRKAPGWWRRRELVAARDHAYEVAEELRVTVRGTWQ